GSRHGIFHSVVLAATSMARLQCGNGGCGTLAMAGSGSVRAGICCCSALCLGLWVDRTRYTCSGSPAEAVGGGRFLPPSPKPDVRRLRSGVGRPVGCVRTRQLSGDRCRSRSCTRCASVGGFL